MKKILALSLVLCVSFLHAKKMPKKSTKSLPANVTKNIKKPVQKTQPKVEETFNPDVLDDALDQNPDALECNDESTKPTIIGRYFTQPMTRLGVATYCALPDRVQLALLAAYFYTEETYESFSEYVQEHYHVFRGTQQDDDESGEEDDTDSPQ